MTSPTKRILEPHNVYGGYRLAWSWWFLAGRDADGGWDQDYEFDRRDTRVFTTEAAAREAIAALAGTGE